MSPELLVIIGDAIVELGGAGPLGPAQTFQQRLAGRTLQVAMHAAEHGPPTALLTQFGEDAFADWIIEQLDAVGLHLDHTRRVPGRNSLRIRGASETTDYRQGTPATAMEDDQYSAVPWNLTGHVFASGEFQALGSGAEDAIRTCFGLARADGASTVFSPALTSDLWPGGPRAASLAFNALSGLIDVLVIGAPYASGRLLGQPEPGPAIEAALKLGVRDCVVVGPNGDVSFGSRAGGEVLGVATGWSSDSLPRFVTALAYAGDVATAVEQATVDGENNATAVPPRTQAAS